MEQAETANTVKSDRVTEYKVSYQGLFWLFIFGSVVGFVLEGLRCVFKSGAWQSHSATVLGPFCIVYGFGAVIVYIISFFVREKGLPQQFLLYAASGAFVEYTCSLFQEIIFGSTSWNYSHYRFNLGGRVSLKMTLVWGLLGVVFVRFVFPALTRFFDEMRSPAWKVCTILLAVFMTVNLMLSAAAVLRWRERLSGRASHDNIVAEFLDSIYNDEKMQSIYPNMNFSR